MEKEKTNAMMTVYGYPVKTFWLIEVISSKSEEYGWVYTLKLYD